MGMSESKIPQNHDCSRGQFGRYTVQGVAVPRGMFWMGDHVLAAYLRQYVGVSRPDGGERDRGLAGRRAHPDGRGLLPPGRRSRRRRSRPSGQQSQHTIQTNGTLLTDEWCELLAQHRFLVGISIDGPPDVHDRYRVDKRGAPDVRPRSCVGSVSFAEHGVDVNVLCTVHAANQDRPLDVYRYFRDELGHHVHPVHPHRQARERDGVPGGRNP